MSSDQKSKSINYTAENWQLLTKISNFSELNQTFLVL